MLLMWDDHQQLQNCRLNWPIFLESVIMLCKSSFLCLGKAQSPLAASHLLACWAFWQIAWVSKYSGRHRSAVSACWRGLSVSRHSLKAVSCNSATGESHLFSFFPLFHQPSLLWHLAKHQILTHLEKVVLWCAKTHHDPAARLWWCQFIWGLSWHFQELPSVFFWWKSWYASATKNVDFSDVNESSSYSRRPCSRLHFHGLAKPLLEMIDKNFLTVRLPDVNVVISEAGRDMAGVNWRSESVKH